MSELIEKQKWSKELKRRFNSWVEVNKPAVLELELLVEIINFAVEGITDGMPDCESCNEGQRSEPNYEHNEGYD